MLALDNLSFINGTLADAMCRIATGTGFATRTLYSDYDETIISVQRPQIVNGIPDLAERPDFADRAIVLTLPPLREGKHVAEKKFWLDFEESAPKIHGVLLSTGTPLSRKPGAARLTRFDR